MYMITEIVDIIIKFLVATVIDKLHDVIYTSRFEIKVDKVIDELALDPRKFDLLL